MLGLYHIFFDVIFPSVVVDDINRRKTWDEKIGSFDGEQTTELIHIFKRWLERRDGFDQQHTSIW